MERKINTKFACFIQNNSGGYFMKDAEKGIGVYVIIEGVNLAHINERADAIFEDFSDYCSCCGERWQSAWESDLYDFPDIWGKLIHLMPENKMMSYNEQGAFIHYMDGTISTIADYYKNKVTEKE